MAETKKPKEIAVDFDGTLAKYDGWKGPRKLGEPVPAMLERVKAELKAGNHVRIYTARVNPGITYEHAMDATDAFILIVGWCHAHIGQILPITYVKSPDIEIFLDDRARQVVENTGKIVGEK